MIRGIEINNFRGFKHVRVEQCRRINVIVGDNGTGKTALFEAIFMALCASTDIAVRLRQARGLDATFNGPPAIIEEAIFSNFFHARNMREPIDIRLLGHGPEARTLKISRSQIDASVVLPFGQPLASGFGATAPITFTWRDGEGKERSASAQITSQGVQFGATGEDLPFFFFFSSNQTITAAENAARFSELSKVRQEQTFVDAFTKEYSWVESLSIEVIAGAPVIHASLRDFSDKLPITDISGGINRLIGIMLALASKSEGVVIVDEIENGIFFKHQVAQWKSLLTLTRERNNQLFISTHSQEWLEALADAAGDEIDDIALWRLERGGAGPVINCFSGRALRAGLEAGGEVR